MSKLDHYLLGMIVGFLVMGEGEKSGALSGWMLGALCFIAVAVEIRVTNRNRA